MFLMRGLILIKSQFFNYKKIPNVYLHTRTATNYTHTENHAVTN